MRPQTANLILGKLCEEQSCQSSESEVTKVSVKLHGDPGRSVVPYRIVSSRVALVILLRVHPQGLHDDDEDDADTGPDCHAQHYRNSLVFFVGMFQVFIVTEESPSLKMLQRKTDISLSKYRPVVRCKLFCENINVSHRQDE